MVDRFVVHDLVRRKGEAVRDRRHEVPGMLLVERQNTIQDTDLQTVSLTKSVEHG